MPVGSTSGYTHVFHATQFAELSCLCRPLPVCFGNMSEKTVKLRGLILRPVNATKFFVGEPGGDGQTVTKTMELRSFNCKCVSSGGTFYIVSCHQGKNKYGVNVMKVLGQVTFRGNETLLHQNVPSRYSEHLCSADDYRNLSRKWTKDHCFGWKVSDAKAFDTPKWIRSNNQERCFISTGLDP